MKLLVIRHAVAEDQSFTGKNPDPPLSQKGYEEFSQKCSQLKPLNLKFDLLLDSHLLRSQQTADIFCKYFLFKKGVEVLI